MKDSFRKNLMKRRLTWTRTDGKETRRVESRSCSPPLSPTYWGEEQSAQYCWINLFVRSSIQRCPFPPLSLSCPRLICSCLSSRLPQPQLWPSFLLRLPWVSLCFCSHCQYSCLRSVHLTCPSYPTSHQNSCVVKGKRKEDDLACAKKTELWEILRNSLIDWRRWNNSTTLLITARDKLTTYIMGKE